MIKIDIKGYENCYQIDENGTVYSLERKVKKWDGLKTVKATIITTQVSKFGYCRVSLRKNGKNVKYLVHRLVAFHFLDVVPGKNYVNHKDGNKKNNHYSNLEWCTPQENTIHSIKVLGSKPGSYQKKGECWYKKRGVIPPRSKAVTVSYKTGLHFKDFESVSDCARFFSKHAAYISMYIRRKRNNKIYNFNFKKT